jgi:uncharacterized protein (DUF2252 family)
VITRVILACRVDASDAPCKTRTVDGVGVSGETSETDARAREHDLRQPEEPAASDLSAADAADGSRSPGLGRLRRRAGTRVVEHPTPDERSAKGNSARDEVPLGSHGDWKPASNRRDPIELLEEQARTRIPELVPIRYGRMLVSPFAFYRGAAAIMAADLATTTDSGLRVQLCGDAHLSNFGGFAAPDRRLVFSINDYDETLPGPFDWDVKRLVASFAVAGRELGFGERRRRAAAAAAARSYRTAMGTFSGMRTMDIWYARLEFQAILEQWGAEAGKKRVKKTKARVARGRTKDNLRAFAQLTHVVDGRRRIVSDPPLIVPIEEVLPQAEHDVLDEAFRLILRSYRRTLPRDRRKLIEHFDYRHAARKVVGVGSVGTRAWIVLLTGRDENDPLFLQFKEAQSSVLEPFLGKSEFANHGQRVVEGQRMMQSASDVMLGWDRIPGIDGMERDFYIRQLWDSKHSANVEVLDPKGLRIYAEICGWTLARAHARTGDPIALAAYLGTTDAFDRAMESFAEAYADQNDRDYASLREAVEAGRIVAERGV